MKKIYITILGMIFLPTLALAETQIRCVPGQNNLSNSLCNPVGAASLPEFLSRFMAGYGEIIGLFSIVMIVYSGFRLIISQGDAEAISNAKASLQYAIVGFITALMAFVLVAATQNFLGANPVTEAERSGRFGIASPLGDTTLIGLVQRMLENFLILIGIVSVLMLITYGFRYIVSAGNEEQASQAKLAITWAIGGLAVSFLAYVIIKATATSIGG